MTARSSAIESSVVSSPILFPTQESGNVMILSTIARESRANPFCSVARTKGLSSRASV